MSLLAIGTIVAVLGLILTFSTSIVIISFRIGHISARVEGLEAWRVTIRADMHEISDQLEKVGIELQKLSTLIMERTDRRSFNKQFEQ